MQKTTPPINKVMQTWVQLYRTQQMLLDAVERSLKQAGLPPLAWYDVLLELQRKRQDGLRQYEIGDKILLNKHNLSRLLDRLGNHDLIERQPCDEDGRGNVIKITHAGEVMLKQVWPVYSQSMMQNFGDRLNADEIHELNRLLNKVFERELPGA